MEEFAAALAVTLALPCPDFGLNCSQPTLADALHVQSREASTATVVVEPPGGSTWAPLIEIPQRTGSGPASCDADVPLQAGAVHTHAITMHTRAMRVGTDRRSAYVSPGPGLVLRPAGWGACGGQNARE